MANTNEFELRKQRRKIEWSDRDQRNAYERERRASSGHRERQLKSRYGITVAQFNAMVEQQNGLCACCKQRRPVDVDHCHDTGKVRGLLCRACNLGLGLFKDSIEGLQHAIEYLRKE